MISGIVGGSNFCRNIEVGLQWTAIRRALLSVYFDFTSVIGLRVVFMIVVGI